MSTHVVDFTGISGLDHARSINAIVGAEDIIDAMDLRCFGIGPRTWVHKLRYQKRDWVLIGVSATVFVGALLLNFFVWKGKLWIPTFLLPGR